MLHANEGTLNSRHGLPCPQLECSRFQAEVIAAISIEKAEFSVNADRNVLLLLVDRLFTSRPGFLQSMNWLKFHWIGIIERVEKESKDVRNVSSGFKRSTAALFCCFGRSAFDRFAKFAALSRLGRSCYTREDRQPFSVLARAEGFEELGELLDCNCNFDPRKATEELATFDLKLQSIFDAERAQAVHLNVIEDLQLEAQEAQQKWQKT